MSTPDDRTCPACGGPQRGRLLLPVGLPEVKAFLALVESRRRGDIGAISKLQKALRRLGWTVYAIEPGAAGGRR